MKRKIIAAMMIVLLASYLVGCVSQDDYDALSAENEKLNSQITELTAENADLNKSNEKLEAEIAKLKDELASINEELNPDEEETEVAETKEAIETPEVPIRSQENKDDDDYSSAFEIGRDISNKMAEEIESIDWDEQYKKADEAGRKAAEWLNGMLGQ